MYATSSSMQSTKIANISEKIDIPTPPATLICATMKTLLMNPSTTMCPAVMLANRRTASTNGFVKQPTVSMIGMRGRGNFKNHGTPGVLKMSL